MSISHMSNQYARGTISATKPFIPPVDEYQNMVAEIMNGGWLTNQGPCVVELEEKLKKMFNVEYLLLVTNGTIAIQMALKAMKIQGEVITTPYSYVATTSSLLWENCVPRFCDIDPNTFNIDPSKLKGLLTNETKAILATNVYGYPCQMEAIQNFADEHGLKVIYDSAHCFGTKVNEESIMTFGDVSTISFHATKLFHTVEGGAIVCKSKEIYEQLKLLRNFGHTSPTTFGSMGINAKMNEFSAAMGLVNLNYVNEIMIRRKSQWDLYQELLAEIGLHGASYELEFNKAYFPLVLKSEEFLLRVLTEMEKENIHLRRYFYPSLNELDFLPIYDACPISEDISRRVICLPLYHELTESDMRFIIQKLGSLC
jgi:dTDP-4-amino-4,6-dideoxygalactose transaminase